MAQTILDSTWILNKNEFRIILEVKENSDEDSVNAKVVLFRDREKIATDSIRCDGLYIDFKDMNEDGFNDLLIFQNSGARANETFNLFLYIRKSRDFKKVPGYNSWPNLFKTDSKGILSACILTGTVQYSFFRIKDSGELIDLKISETDYNLDGKAYDRGLRKAKSVKMK